MPQISKNNRDQLQMLSISEHVSKDSLVKVIDVFIDTADLSGVGFQVKGTSKEGRPAFSADTLMMYGIHQREGTA